MTRAPDTARPPNTVVGVAWIALFYITGQDLPLPSLGPWNLAIGFGFIIAGLGLATKWR